MCWVYLVRTANTFMLTYICTESIKWKQTALPHTREQATNYVKMHETREENRTFHSISNKIKCAKVRKLYCKVCNVYTCQCWYTCVMCMHACTLCKIFIISMANRFVMCTHFYVENISKMANRCTSHIIWRCAYVCCVCARKTRWALNFTTKEINKQTNI